MKVVYKTDDGMEFDNREQAEKYEKMTEKAEWYMIVYKKAWKIQSEKYSNFCICGKPCSGLYSSHKLNCKRFEKSVKSKTERLLKQTALEYMFEDELEVERTENDPDKLTDDVMNDWREMEDVENA